MNYLDLFHGIGGFALGAYLAGMKFDNHYCSDIEKYCVELYKIRFPESIQLGDISKIDFEKLKDDNEWIITGGFPCQDISIAGKGEGIEGKRSGLWFEYWRAIRILRPRFAIIENVGAITVRGLDRVLSSLAEIGYNAEWQDIRAEDMGAPHRRERIWIIAYSASFGRSTGCNNEQGYENNISEIRETEKDKQSRNIGKHGIEQVYKDVSNPSIERLEREKPERQQPGKQGLSAECNNELSNSGHNWSIERFRELRKNKSITQSRADIRERKEKHEVEEWWSIEPAICSMVDGLPSGLDRYEGRLSAKSYKRVAQLKGLGNAIVPQIAELLFNQIKGKVHE